MAATILEPAQTNRSKIERGDDGGAQNRKGEP